MEDEELIRFYLYLYLLFELILEVGSIYVMCTTKNKFILIVTVVTSVMNLSVIYGVLEGIFAYNFLLEMNHVYIEEMTRLNETLVDVVDDILVKHFSHF
jgi:hypothetical protein